MPSKTCVRPGCGVEFTAKPNKLALRQYCSRRCANIHHARHGFHARERMAFTDAELIQELRKRSEWVTGSLTMCNALAAAADRLEELIGAQKGRAA